MHIDHPCQWFSIIIQAASQALEHVLFNGLGALVYLRV